jgi:indole-3-glycerol phosphate synthase
MPGFLAEMAAESARRARDAMSRGDLSSRVASASPARRLRLPSSGFDVIAEAKLASPSEGVLADGGVGKVVALAREYAKAGALAVSVLTEETRFGGGLSHLEAVSTAVDLPVMRKDFLVDPVQVTEARVFGASGVLLIARMLSIGLLEEMTDLALSLGMFVLVETFDEADLELSSTVFDREILVGVNCRDLTSLEVTPSRFRTLAPSLPGHLPAVAESGLATPEDVAGVAGQGYRLALIGSALVSGGDPGARLPALIEAGRKTRAGAGA